jgi:REP element-mobilizing transposase RayT
MARTARQPSESGIHHVMLRGVNRELIFRDDEDRETFLHFLTLTKSLSGCRILAYCLMSNHVHLVARVGSEDLGQMIKRLSVRYVGWHNRKYGRVGHLFQDRFKSRPVDNDEYLQTLLRYVWSNPVQAGLVRQAQDYRWSSLRLLGRPDALLDESELLALIPLGTLWELARLPAPQGWVPKVVTHSRPLMTDAEAADALRGLCDRFGVGSLDELPQAGRDRILAELLDRGLSLRQVVRVAGVSIRAVRRVASAEAEWSRFG